MSANHQVGFWIGLRELYDHLTARRKRQLNVVLLLMLLGALAELATIGAIIPFLSLLAGQEQSPHLEWLTETTAWLGDGAGERLTAATAMLVILILAAGAVRLRLTWSTQSFVFGLGHDLSVDIQRRILLQPYSFHVDQNTSVLIAALEKVQGVVGVLLQVTQATVALFIALFIIGGLVYFDPFTALVGAAAFSLVYLLVSAATRHRFARNSAIIGSAYDERIKIVQESLDGIRDVIIDGTQPIYLDAFRRVDRRFSRAHVHTAFMAAAPRFIIEALGMVLIAMLALIISQRQGNLAEALPILGALALGAQRLLPLLQQIYNGWSVASGHASLLAQVLALVRLSDSEEAVRRVPGPPLPLQDRITVEQLSFAYPSQRGMALENVSLVISRGSRIALVGKTGSGKTTLADLLMGLLDPTKGRITVDGVPLTRDNRHHWQKSIAHVPQTIFIADTSIAGNIALGVHPDAMDIARVIEAAKSAQLHDFVQSLPESYHTHVGERGVRLSGGQRQRLGIARAIYKEAPVLVLDEATSALDDTTEAAVMRSLDELGESRTIIMIAHRYSTIAHCGTVARLDNGRLVELGSVEEVAGARRAAETGARR